MSFGGREGGTLTNTTHMHTLTLTHTQFIVSHVKLEEQRVSRLSMSITEMRRFVSNFAMH